MIRQATLKDVHDLVKLTLEFMDEGWDKYPFKRDKSLIDTIKDLIANNIFLISNTNIKANGMLAGIIRPSVFCKDQLIAQEIIWYVSKDSRKGLSTVGARMLREFEKTAKDKGANLIVMSHIGNLNSDSMGKLYDKRNYRVFETQYLKEV